MTSMPSAVTQGGKTERDAGLHSMRINDRAHRNGTKLSQGRFILGIRKQFFIVRMVHHHRTGFLEGWLIP